MAHRAALEGLGVKLFGDTYRRRRVLVTGHTGFKGSWLSLWLTSMGAEVAGFALDPEGVPNHWDLLALDCADVRADIRDPSRVQASLAAHEPEIIFHLAAQPLVRRSYRDPLATWSANVMGTANLLEACRHTPSVRAVVVVTTDKVYRNQEWQRGYHEEDQLGGHDPYSASKAACELVVDSYRNAFLSVEKKVLLASARAGNVVGGGDWSEDRLIPDLVRAMTSGQALMIRAPHARRPWQHVLDCVSGYLLLGQRLLQGDAACARAWNFGPAATDNREVVEVLQSMRKSWPALSWQQDSETHPHETGLLHLDSTRAHEALSWRPVWTLDEALRHTADWYRLYAQDGTPISAGQMLDFLATAQQRDVVWTH